jgi:hypothetical protein
MTRFEEFKSMDIDELAKWINKNGQFDGSPWMEWFDKHYCKKCEPITLPTKEYRRIFGCSSYAETMTCAYCELKGKCKFFPDLDYIPDNEDIILMWLDGEVK